MAKGKMNRKGARKGKGKGARKGKLSNNTKVDITTIFKKSDKVGTVQSVSGVGTYIYLGMSPYNLAWVNLQSTAEWTSYSNLYDEFRIVSCSMSYVPTLTQGVPGTANNVVATIHSWVDRDGNSPVSNSVSVPSKLAQYGSYRKGSFYKPHTRTLKCKPFWVDCKTGPVDENFIVANQPFINAGYLQSIGMYAENLPSGASVAVGSVNYSFKVQFRGKKPAMFTYDPVSGSTVITPVESLTKESMIYPQASVLLSELNMELSLHDLSGNAIVAPPRPTNIGPTGPKGDTGPTGGIFEI